MYKGLFFKAAKVLINFSLTKINTVKYAVFQSVYVHKSTYRIYLIILVALRNYYHLI